MTTSVVAGCWFALVLSSLPAGALDVQDVPNPRTGHSGWITDRAQVLGALGPMIEARLSKLNEETGTEVAVVTLPSIGEAVPREFATALFNHWGVGRKGQDNGALVLHVLDQRRLEIETGYGLEGVLPDAKCSWLIHEVALPLFREADFARGHAALSYGLDYAIRHPEAGHGELVGAAKESVRALPAQPRRLVGTAPPEASPSQTAGNSMFHWLGALLASLAALVLRLRAHKAFYRNKAPLFKWPWAGWAIGFAASLILLVGGGSTGEAAVYWLGSAALWLTAIVVGAFGARRQLHFPIRRQLHFPIETLLFERAFSAPSPALVTIERTRRSSAVVSVVNA